MEDILYTTSAIESRIREMVTETGQSGSKIKTNGYTYVDLGLPSGTLWATMNVGAESETDQGLYFAWGETQGYRVEPAKGGFYEVVGRTFDEASYQHEKWSSRFNRFDIIKYNTGDEKTMLDLEDDAAYVNMGGDWHMPSPAQIEELLNTDYVTNEFVENYNSSGVSGALFTSVADNTKKLFIPFNGDIYQGINEFTQIQIWSNTVSESLSSDANLLFGDPTSYETLRIDQYFRYFGLGVRGVIGGNNTTTNNGGHSIDLNTDNTSNPGYVPDLEGGGNLNLDNGNTEIGGHSGSLNPLKP